jgi:outer membrane protein TolC
MEKKIGADKHIVIMLCTLFIGMPLFSQNAVQPDQQRIVLTIDQAVDCAKQNSRTLKSAAIDLKIKERAGETAWNVFVPTVQATGTMSRSNDYSSTVVSILSAISPSYEAPATTESMHWSAVGNLSVSYTFSLALIQGIKAVHTDYESGRITWQQTLDQTELSVRKMFYALLLQQESLALQETTLENARQRVIQSQLNFKNGTIPELSFLQAQVNYENQKPVVEKQEQLMAQQLDTFAFILGLPVGKRIDLKGSIDPVFVDVNAPELITRFAAQNPDVVLLKKNIEMTQIQLAALDLQSFTPALSLSWGYQPVSTSGDGALDMQWLNGDNWYDNGSFSATVAWNLTNMLPFSANRQKAKDVQAAIEKMNISLETIQQNNELEIQKLVDSLAQSRASIQSSERSSMLAQKAYDMSEKAYKSGATELLDLRDAEMQLNQARLALVSEKYNYLSGLFDLEYKLGTSLSEDGSSIQNGKK